MSLSKQLQEAVTTEARRRYPAATYGGGYAALQRAGREAGKDPTAGAGEFYKIGLGLGDEAYFYRTGTLKNGNATGYRVDAHVGRKPSKPKKDSVYHPTLGVEWKRIQEKDVPPKVMARFKGVMESLDWEVMLSGCRDLDDLFEASLKDVPVGKTNLLQAIRDALSGGKWKKRDAILNAVKKRYPAAVPGGDYKYIHWGLDELEDDGKIERKKSGATWAYRVLSEARGDTGKLSTVKKKPAPHMWFIAKAGSGWVVSIGDPRKGGSKTKWTFHKKDDLKWWVEREMPDQVSRDHVIDQTGLKLVPDYYTQWYVDNMMKGKS